MGIHQVNQNEFLVFFFVQNKYFLSTLNICTTLYCIWKCLETNLKKCEAYFCFVLWYDILQIYCFPDKKLDIVCSRRTKAEQEVLALIAPLGKLGRFEEAADFFSSYCVTISLPSGAIRTNTSCSAVVLLGLLKHFLRPKGVEVSPISNNRKHEPILSQLNMVKLCYGGFLLGSSQFSLLP